MNRFYFDLLDGRRICRDEEGSCFESAEAARQAALQSLLELMKSRPVKEEAAELMFVVRNDYDETSFTARLLLLVT
jgi:hypothetical protein